MYILILTNQPRPCPQLRRRAFTMIEMMITVAIMGIAAAIILPSMANNDYTYANAAASLMVGDFDFAQSIAITQPADMTIVKFDPVNSRWWVAPASTPNTPYIKSYSTETIDTTLGIGKAYLSEGVTFALTNVTDNTITYNAFGQVNQATNPQILFTFRTATATIIIDAETGFLTVE